MAGSSWSVFAKTVLIPLLIASTLYVVAFLILKPLYRRYHNQLARYSNYTPLGSSGFAQQTTSLFSPYLIEPSRSLIQKIRDRLAGGLYRFVFPSVWARERDARLAERDDEEDDMAGGLFDAESGEAMVGFDIHEHGLGRNGRVGRRGGRHDGGRSARRTGRPGRKQEQSNTDRDSNVQWEGDHDDDSNRRLSRDLEEGFRDDSGSEDSEEEVTAGRRTVSRRGSEVRS